MRIPKLTALALVLVCPLAWAEAPPPDPKTEPAGTWRFKEADRAVKVVVIGGSIGAWPNGNFGDFMQGACKNIELVNRSRTGYGAWALKWRFRKQVLENWSVRPKLKDPKLEHWLVYSGGLNSIATPGLTIRHTRGIFVLAKRHGIRSIGLTPSPWGDLKDPRWRDFSGVDYHAKTQRVVDYVMGRLKRSEALAGYTEKGEEGKAEWGEGELPTIAVDLYDSSLRHKDAPLQDRKQLEERWDGSRKLQKQHPDKKTAVEAAMAVPRWFMRPELRAFDHIHPKTEGHKIMAEVACPKLPASWGCDCKLLSKLHWEKGKIVGP